MKLIAVLAGNNQQFVEWVRPRANKDAQYVYINRVEHTQGMIFDAYFIVGSFFERPDQGLLYDATLDRLRSHLNV